MKIVRVEKFFQKSKDEKDKINRMLVVSNLALTSINKKLEKSATVIYTTSVVIESLNILLSLLNNKEKINSSSLATKVQTLNKMISRVRNSELEMPPETMDMESVEVETHAIGL